jgi:hypothetical protein
VIGPQVKTRSLNRKLVVPDREGVGRKPREIGPRPIRVKKERPQAGMSHLEKMHLLSQCKELEIDPQEIDSSINYYENKKHLEDLAKQKGVSEEELHGQEAKIEADVSAHEEYLNQIRNELESAGYRVVEPEQ